MILAQPKEREMQKPVHNCPGYFACDNGHIWRNGRKLTAHSNGNGYLRITTSINSRVKTRYVHRMVCEAWHGLCPEGDYQCRHKDGSRNNNRPDNLCWGTRQENEADKEQHGTRLWGERMSHSVLTADMVGEARRRCNAGEQIKDVAADIGIKDRVLADAVTGRRWARLPGAIIPYSTKRKLTDEQVLSIRTRGASETRKHLAAEFGVSRNAIFQALHRKTYTHI